MLVASLRVCSRHWPALLLRPSLAWLGTGEEVAIKFIQLGPRFYSKYVERELFNHRLLAHPHIVCFKEVFITSHWLAIVMEYVGGGNLQQYVEKKQRLPEWEARCFFQQVRRWRGLGLGSVGSSKLLCPPAVLWLSPAALSLPLSLYVGLATAHSLQHVASCTAVHTSAELAWSWQGPVGWGFPQPGTYQEQRPAEVTGPSWAC